MRATEGMEDWPTEEAYPSVESASDFQWPAAKVPQYRRPSRAVVCFAASHPTGHSEQNEWHAGADSRKDICTYKGLCGTWPTVKTPSTMTGNSSG